MPKLFWTACMAVAFALASCTVVASELGMIFATQRTAPARLVRAALAQPNLLKAARLKNESKKRITSYQIGWASVRPNAIDLRKGAPINVPAGIKPSRLSDVPQQAVSLDEHAQSIIFFVAEVSFADGSHWNVDINNIALDAGLNLSH